MAADHGIRILRLKEVLKQTGLSRSSVYAAIAEGCFPRQVKLSERSVGFLSEEVDAWIKARAAQRGYAGPGEQQ